MVSDRQVTLGVHLLETITKGMYSEPMHSIREYVQNAFDSIRKARQLQIMPPDAGTIRITVDKHQRLLKIRDDGVGLSPEEASVALMDIGASTKGLEEAGVEGQSAGFRGIGRMAGISYCKTLRFTTSDGKDGRKCDVVFDAAGINRLTRKGGKPTTIVRAIDDNSSIVEEVVDDDEHYMEVCLEGVREDSFLDEEKVAKYLSLNAPVDYDPQVWRYGERIYRFAEELNYRHTLDCVRIVLCDTDGTPQQDIRKPYKNTFRTANARGQKPRTVRVSDVQRLPFEGIAGNGWWGWVAKHDREGALNDSGFQGLRVRMHNIAIGDEGIIRQLFQTPSHATWCFGEIFVTDPGLVPNAQRDNFEPNGAWSRCKATLKDQAENLDRDVRRESNERSQSPQKRINEASKVRRAASTKVRKGFVSREEREATAKRIQEAQKKLETSKKKAKTDEEREEVQEEQKALEDALVKVNETKKTQTDSAWSHLDRSARKVLQIVFEVLGEELKEPEFIAIQEKIQERLQPGKKEK